MNISRLLKVIEAIEEVAPQLFEMRCWARKTECGTVGCAAGIYILANPDCGLRLDWNVIGLPGIAGLSGENGSVGVAALQAHFGLSLRKQPIYFTEATTKIQLGPTSCAASAPL